MGKQIGNYNTKIFKGVDLMKAKYTELFRTIVKAYYEGKLEETIEDMINTPHIDKEKLCGIISTLCGVDVQYSENFVKEVMKAISNYENIHKIVKKIGPCSSDCASLKGETHCQKSCPFTAIFLSTDDQSSYIDNDICTDCGSCVAGCPNDNILDVVEFMPMAEMIKEGEPVIAAVAPAIMGQFGEDVTINQLRTAFKKIGYSDMIEVAFFADMLTLKEAVEFDHHVKNKEDLMITSCCCPMWVGMLKKVYNELVNHVSPSVSPMVAAGRVLKKLNPNCKVVFVGPCIAKKAEAKEKDIQGAIDYVLTFEELKTIFEALDIRPEELEECDSIEYASRGGRLYARTGGVSIAVGEAIEKLFPEKHKLFKAIQADGVKDCKELLDKAKNGNVNANFIEGMGCFGGCIGGPKVLVPREESRGVVDSFAENSEIKIAVDSSCMNKILKQIDINSIEDFKHPERIDIFEREF